MGPESKMTEGTLYFDGVPVSIVDSGAMVEFTPELPEGTALISTVSGEAIECRIRLKRVSRKRFIKKLMAAGFCRNLAANLAGLTRSERHSYAEMLFAMRMLGMKV